MAIYELDTNKIQMDIIYNIMRDVSNYPIYNLQFQVKSFRLKITRTLKKKTEGLRVRYQREDDPISHYHKISGYIKAQVIAFDHLLTITINANATAWYVDTMYQDRIESYLYSYMVSLIENDDTISKYKQIKLPTYLSNIKFSQIHSTHYILLTEQEDNKKYQPHPMIPVLKQTRALI